MLIPIGMLLGLCAQNSFYHLLTSLLTLLDTQTMKRCGALIAAFTLSLGVLVSPATAQISDGTWTLTTESVNLNLKGVSPYVEKTSSGSDRLWFGSSDPLPDPIMVVDCSEVGTCTRQTLSSRFGSDPTIVTLKDGTRKVFFVEMGPSGRKIRFATITGNSLAHGTVSDLNVADSSVSQEEKAWGVPDSVVLPDGRVRVYWVVSDKANAKPGLPESIVSATSTDTTANTFVRDEGFRLTGGYVDSDILRALDGDWVMMISTGPGAGTQYLYMATSKDGLKWDVYPTPISSSSESALDPTGYETGTNTWRIYYASSAPGMIKARSYVLKRAVLKWEEIASAPSPIPTPTVVKPATTAKKTTMTCVKGKTTKKVTGVNPKCPTGYKKKA